MAVAVVAGRCPPGCGACRAATSLRRRRAARRSALNRRGNRERAVRGVSRAGEEFVVEVGAVAHGGFCVARHEGRAIFVRHALPGELVRVRVSEGGAEDTFWRADAIEVLTPSPDRVEPPCPYAGPGRCGGCDWQHVAVAAQRELKAAVVAEQLRRLAGIARDVVVEAVAGVPAGEPDGLGWRTRVTYAVDDQGRAGLRPHRSHEVIPVESCLIAHPGVRALGVEARRWDGVASVEAIASSEGDRQVQVTTAGDHTRTVDGRDYVRERAAGRSWRVSGAGFWQVHPGAADVLVTAVLDALAPREGERALDLYCGVGLFAGALGPLVGAGGGVLAVEGSQRAVRDARRNLHDLPQVELVAGRVDAVLASRSGDLVDLVVLDPPRTGAKARVVRQIVQRRPRAVAYVACDPAALARDLATFATHGYRLTGLRAFDLFPMTRHIECVAVLHPDAKLAGAGESSDD